MNSTYYTSLTGMIAASYGLQNTSNNVANMQSPGFKRTDVFYSSLGDGNGYDGLGSGVRVGGQSTNFKAGTHVQTGNPSDLAIVGNGFFIVQLKNGELLYTRDGEFDFNKDGILIDKHSGGIVQGYDAKGSLVSISQFGPKTVAGKATHFIDLNGEFVMSERAEADKTDKLKYSDITFSVDTIYDANGKAHTVTFVFQTKESQGTQDHKLDKLKWTLLSATCKDSTISFDLADQQIEFDLDSNGAPSLDHNLIKFKLNDQDITLNFGGRGTDSSSSVRLFNKDTGHGNSSVNVKKNDGYGEGKQLDYSFDDNGQISYNYDNGQSEKGLHVALAVFDDLEHTLVQAHDNLFRAKNINGRHIGRPNKQNFGTIQPKQLEQSNVDSTTEFANIVVLQRMFQACSQIMDIDKQLVEELNRK